MMCSFVGSHSSKSRSYNSWIYTMSTLGWGGDCWTIASYLPKEASCNLKGSKEEGGLSIWWETHFSALVHYFSFETKTCVSFPSCTRLRRITKASFRSSLGSRMPSRGRPIWVTRNERGQWSMKCGKSAGQFKGPRVFLEVNSVSKNRRILVLWWFHEICLCK